MTVSSLWNYSGHFLTSFCHLPPLPSASRPPTWTLFNRFFHLPPPPSCPTPPATLALNWCTPPKNDLKWPEIKQVKNSEPYDKINRLMSLVLQNIVGLTQEKASYTIKFFKMGISTIITRCKLGRFFHGWSHIVV